MNERRECYDLNKINNESLDPILFHYFSIYFIFLAVKIVCEAMLCKNMWAKISPVNFVERDERE